MATRISKKAMVEALEAKGITFENVKNMSRADVEKEYNKMKEEENMKAENTQAPATQNTENTNKEDKNMNNQNTENTAAETKKEEPKKAEVRANAKTAMIARVDAWAEAKAEVTTKGYTNYPHVRDIKVDGKTVFQLWISANGVRLCGRTKLIPEAVRPAGATVIKDGFDLSIPTFTKIEADLDKYLAACVKSLAEAKAEKEAKVQAAKKAKAEKAAAKKAEKEAREKAKAEEKAKKAAEKEAAKKAKAEAKKAEEAKAAAEPEAKAE